MADEISVLENQKCSMCNKDTLTLTEAEREIPYFGKVYIFSMSCSSCNYHMADVESAEQNEPVRFTIEVDCEEDMKIRVVKSSQATIKIPHVATITPGTASNGYVTNIEGILNRIKVQTESLRDNAEDDEERRKAKNLVKKLMDVMWGREKLKIILEDPSGNSAIISEKAVKTKLNN
ncbi:ZPR1 zinc finger domain-containing protein [Candidatus Woesearchaeota archaeon]|nr:ZPR1 zinc finger domain-containing protein [Candidatus Woesearchaeota archaeon]